MIAALDFETIPNHNVIHLLPEPKPKKGLVDLVKIANDIAAKKESQIEDMALDPLTGRILCYAFVSNDFQKSGILTEATDECERELVLDVFKVVAQPDFRMITHNGIKFDVPYLYKRALVLNLDLSDLAPPPLTTWTQRYRNDRHYDLMKCWTDWASGQEGYVSLEYLAAMITGQVRAEMDYSQFLEQMKTKEGRDEIESGCINHTRLTWELFERMLGTLFV